MSAVTDLVGSGGGQPLAPAVRAEMEGRFGADFSGVRIHTGALAARSAAAVGAEAYTAGNVIVFGRGSPVPGDARGWRTLAHELAHVEQQRRGAVSGTPVGGGLTVSDPSDAFEREAAATARAVLAGPRPVARAVTPGARAVSGPGGAAAQAAPAAIPVQRQDDQNETRMDTPQSCAGWESDPQSFSIRIAQNFMQDAFGQSVGTPVSVTKSNAPAGKEWLVHYVDKNLPVESMFVLVDLSQVPGKVSAYTYYPGQGKQQCSYSYSCGTGGAVSFTRIECHRL